MVEIGRRNLVQAAASLALAGSVLPRSAIAAPAQLKTLKMCVTAVPELGSTSPAPQIVYQKPYPYDLSIPEPWRDQPIYNFQGTILRMKFLVTVTPDTESFYPPETNNYLRIDMATWTTITNNFPDESKTFSMWVDPDPADAYAAGLIQVGPLAGEQLFVTYALKFENHG